MSFVLGEKILIIYFDWSDDESGRRYASSLGNEIAIPTNLLEVTIALADRHRKPAYLSPLMPASHGRSVHLASEIAENKCIQKTKAP